MESSHQLGFTEHSSVQGACPGPCPGTHAPSFQSRGQEEVQVTKALGTQKKEPANLGTWRGLEIPGRRRDVKDEKGWGGTEARVMRGSEVRIVHRCPGARRSLPCMG